MQCRDMRELSYAWSWFESCTNTKRGG